MYESILSRSVLVTPSRYFDTFEIERGSSQTCDASRCITDSHYIGLCSLSLRSKNVG